MTSLLCPYIGSTSCRLSQFLLCSVGIGCKKMKEMKNDVDMNVQCYLMHVGKDSWKEKVPTIVKQGALRFLVCPNSINQSVRGVG